MYLAKPLAGPVCVVSVSPSVSIYLVSSRVSRARSLSGVGVCWDGAI